MTLDTRGADTTRLRLTPDADALAEARRFVRLCAERCGIDGDRADDVVQAAAELLAAGGRAHRPAAVEVREGADGIGIVVDLEVPGVLDVREGTAALLSELSLEWGWRRQPDHIQVWCEVARG
ncbi:hypothetical protein [Kineococcus glutinatus]|uniref:Serine/threonine-protein kinase RsbW n=1 Tax=Kineococcus glutinatus TaxID=1070872 RepID=A0ABP9HUV8_9ACTN